MIAQSIVVRCCAVYILHKYFISLTGVFKVYLPSSAAFFQGQSDANSGLPTPKKPPNSASYEEKMYFRGFMQQERKLTKLAEIQTSRQDLFTFA